MILPRWITITYKIELIKITSKNWRLVSKLQVDDHQQLHIETNEQSLLEAAYDTQYNWFPNAIVVNQQYIGFTMFGDYNTNDGSIWLDRLMIDQNFQGQGYGKAALDYLLKYLKQNFSITKIYLSVHETNKQAIQLYQSFGFVNTLNIDPTNKELIFIYSIIK